MAQAQLRPGEETKPAAKEIQMPEQMLSTQAQDTLLRAGFRSNLINQLTFMLKDATKRNGEDMPQKLEGWTKNDEGKLIPDIYQFAPDTTTRRTMYNTFASPEGQRFMRTYYDRLYRDQNTGQWKISGPLAKKSEKKPPKTRLAKIVPARRNL